MIIKTKGIVFRALKYGETSVITDIYTEERGLQSYILNGVRAKKPKFHAGLVQVMSLVDMVAYAREGQTLQHVKELRSAFPFQKIPFDIMRSAVGTFMIELAQKTIKEHETNPELFAFLFDSFIYLDQSAQSFANIHLSFMVKLCAFLGIQPNTRQNEANVYFDLKEGEFALHVPSHGHFMGASQSDLLHRLMLTPFEECHTIMLKSEDRRQFLNQMSKYYEFHIPNFESLKTLSVLGMF
jgi:DNA repair protein RecO (recombination protein O)